ncbi:NAD-dependent epimerase/dehydratase family protein [Pseudonocardia lacus]|uniref:NAD-dependent epimerase/dehydratase family protein n=1 Tax=Pseudonocardia lacus TaxID=2835865 RepID=UPI001BDDA35A|nr:NAD-dependent epimerase/dehydratase family protein [Pseudonocardia lacus]
MNAEHVVFGAGAIGLATAAVLPERSESVRMVNRSGRAAAPDGVEVVAGGAADPAFTVAVAAGARVVYQTLNPPYHRWPAEFPALQAGVLAAARAAGARLVSMDNVYGYGRPNGRPLVETRPAGAHTVKGRLRVAMAADLLAEHRAGRVEVVIAKASDYFGPGAGAQSNLGDRVFGPAARGRPATVLGDPDQPHTYTFVPDIGRALAELGSRDGVAGEVWHVPNDPDTRTTRELVAIVQQLAGHPGAGVRRTPPAVLRVLGLWNPTVRSLLEMQYQFEEPFAVDSTKIADRLGLRATPLGSALDRVRAGSRP